MDDVLASLVKIPDQLVKLNQALERTGKAKFWLVENSDFSVLNFNTNYRLTPEPRFVLGWKGWRPGLVLQQIYLIYLPDQVEYTWDTRQPDLIHTRLLTEEEKAKL